MQIPSQALRGYRSLLLVRGILGILFGVLALSLSPTITLLVLVYLFGGYALLGGIVAVALAFRESPEQGWALLLIEGLLGLVAGLVAFVWPAITAFALLFLVAGWAIVTGIMQIVAALTRLPGIGHKWLLLLSGLASIVLGILIALWPGAGLLTVIWLIGIYAIVFGVMSLAAYFQSRSLTPSFPRREG